MLVRTYKVTYTKQKNGEVYTCTYDKKYKVKEPITLTLEQIHSIKTNIICGRKINAILSEYKLS